jgi:hypothetical protein
MEDTKSWIVVKGITYLTIKNGEYIWTGDKKLAHAFTFEEAEQLARYNSAGVRRLY